MSIKRDLINHDMISYTSGIYMGEQKVRGEVVFDTGSGWLTFPLNTCDNCANKEYDMLNSTSSRPVASTTKLLVYGSATLYG